VHFLTYLDAERAGFVLKKRQVLHCRSISACACVSREMPLGRVMISQSSMKGPRMARIILKKIFIGCTLKNQTFLAVDRNRVSFGVFLKQALVQIAAFKV